MNFQAITASCSTQAGTAVPAQLKGARVLFGAMPATQAAANGRHLLEGFNDLARPRHIALVHDPDLRIRVHNGQLAHSALRIFVEHVRFDPGFPEKIPDQVCVGQAGGGINFLQGSGC